MAAGGHVRVYNVTRSRWIAQEGEVADSFLRRFRGLMGRRSLPSGGALILRPCSSIHTMFMRFPIDAVFVDEDWQVVRILGSLRPWRLSPLVRRAHGVLELPSGTVANSSVEIGDRLAILDVVQGATPRTTTGRRQSSA